MSGSIRSVFRLAATVIAMFTVFGCGRARPIAVPGIEVDAAVRHFSPQIASEATAEGGGVVGDEFQLRNITTSTIIASVASKNCSCVRVESDHESLGILEIPASESRIVKVYREVPPGGGPVAASVTFHVKQYQGKGLAPLTLSVDRDVIPDVYTTPLVMREQLTEKSPRVLTRTLEITAASRDPDWLQRSTIAAETPPVGFDVDEVLEESACHEIADKIHARKWRIRITLDRASFNPDRKPKIATVLRLQVRAATPADRVISRDIPVTISDDFSSPPSDGVSMNQD